MSQDEISEAVLNSLISSVLFFEFFIHVVCTHLISASSSHEVDMFLFILHPLNVFSQGSLFCVRIRGIEFQQFGQTSSVCMIFNDTQLDATNNKQIFITSIFLFVCLAKLTVHALFSPITRKQSLLERLGTNSGSFVSCNFYIIICIFTCHNMLSHKQDF